MRAEPTHVLLIRCGRTTGEQVPCPCTRQTSGAGPTLLETCRIGPGVPDRRARCLDDPGGRSVEFGVTGCRTFEVVHSKVVQ